VFAAGSPVVDARPFGAQAAREGDSLVSIVTKNVMWNCGWPGPEIFHLDEVRTIQR
jgi:hypothetical protein